MYQLYQNTCLRSGTTSIVFTESFVEIVKGLASYNILWKGGLKYGFVFANW